MKYFAHIILLSILILFIVACGDKERENTESEFVRKAVPVNTDTARATQFTSNLSYHGSLLAIKTARIIPEIPAKIEALNVQIGDRVKTGDVLVQMDISTLSLQLKQAEAGVAVAEANLNDAQKNWERVQTLRKENAVSEQQYEKTKLGLEAAQSQMNQTKAGLDLLKMQVDKATLGSPFSGVITSKGFEVGDLFSPAVMKPVYTLQDVSRIKVELQITSREIIKIQKGQHALLKVDYLDQPVAGIVTLVGVAADPLSKTFFVECQFDNDSGQLRAGTFGKVEISVDEISDVVVIPKTSVIDRSHIFIVENDHAYRRDIEILKESLNEYIVGRGLEPAEIYVTSGAYILSDSSLVQIMN